MNGDREFEVALDAARMAGEVLRRHFAEGTTVWGKESHNLVSAADLEAERLIAETIRDAFPLHSILGEEEQAGDLTAEHLWVVDPLDGTNNFAHGLPQCAVSIAYCHNQQTHCGVIYDPFRDELYTARKGGQAYKNDQPISVGRQKQLNEALVSVGFYYDRGKMMEATLDAIRDLFYEKIHGIRRFGAAALDLCGVACGQYGAFFEYQLSPWDFAAGRLIVEAAGGQVTTARGTALPLQPTSILATNGMLHAAMLAIIERHHP